MRGFELPLVRFKSFTGISNVSDLVEADAEYCNMCIKKFFATVRSTTDKKTCTNADKIEKKIQYIYEYIEKNSNECQLCLTVFMDKIQGSHCPHIQTVKAQLLKNYGDDIMIQNYY